jgi:hypothetical protein
MADDLKKQPAEDERGALPHAALRREDKDERGERKRFERDHHADENKVQGDHLRPDPLGAVAQPRRRDRSAGSPSKDDAGRLCLAQIRSQGQRSDGQEGVLANPG